MKSQVKWTRTQVAGGYRHSSAAGNIVDRWVNLYNRAHVVTSRKVWVVEDGFAAFTTLSAAKRYLELKLATVKQ